MELYTTEKDYLPKVADMKEPYDLIRFTLKLVSFDDVLAALRVQYPDRHELILYMHGDTLAIQQSGGKCGVGDRGVPL